MSGRKILLRGNHDRVFTDEELLEYFDKVYPEGVGVEIEIFGNKYLLNHYPTLGVQNVFNLVGHVHSAWRVQLNMINVSVDANHFRPLNAKEIEFYRKAIFDMYDEDVWVAYNNSNAYHNGKRGKARTYFRKNIDE